MSSPETPPPADAAGAATAPSAEPTPELTTQDVAHLAHLARLALTPEELETFRGQLDVVLHSVARVARVATDDVVPTTHAVPLTNVYRPDVVRPGLEHAAALAAAPAAEEGRFRVPQILGEEQ